MVGIEQAVGQIAGSKELILEAEQIVIADNVREYSINDDFSIGFSGSCSLDGKHFNPRISYRDNDVSFVLSPDVFEGLKDIRDFAKDFVHKIGDGGKFDDTSDKKQQEISASAPPPPPEEDNAPDKTQKNPDAKANGKTNSTPTSEKLVWNRASDR
ncbi:hypothetical protein MIDIC_290005 [Alphaproteobacteria bacterium]